MTQTQVDVAAAPLLNDPRRDRWRSLRLWLVSFLLFLPFCYPTIAHFVSPPADGVPVVPNIANAPEHWRRVPPEMPEFWRDRVPTGFIQPDMPYYVGNAREHFDDGGFHLFYGLPYSPNYTTPRVYFQPQTLLMGIWMRLTGMDPALVYLLFGAISSVVCVRLSITLFEHLVGLNTAAKWLALVGFIWGGGLLVAAGALKWMRSGNLNDLFAFDPFDGMWFLNFGRNFIYPHEAYYHAVWLGAAICLLRQRYWAGFALVALSSISHPFTGLQLICIVLGWAFLERFWIGDRRVPIPFVAALFGLLLCHLGYYQWFLGRSLEHKQVEEQWIVSTQDWTYEFKHMIPAYALAAMMTAWVIRTPRLAGSVFASPWARLLAMWAIASFALANNEFAFRPNVQPLHFTRGYVWMALYLLGLPALIAALDWLLSRRIKAVGIAGVVAAMAVLVSDNAVFLATFHHRSNTALNEIWVQSGFRDLAKFLSRDEHRGATVLTPDVPGVFFNHFSYLITTYTPLRTWHSHPFNTPEIRQRHIETVELFGAGRFLPEWSRRKLLVVISPKVNPPQWLTERGGRRIFANQSYAVYQIDPAPAATVGGQP